MWHLHPELVQVVAEQRMSQRRQQAETERLLRGARPTRRPSRQATRRRWLLARWPVRA